MYKLSLLRRTEFNEQFAKIIIDTIFADKSDLSLQHMMQNLRRVPHQPYT
jgi:hypothetical protein